MKNGLELITTHYEDGRIVQELFDYENDRRRMMDRTVLDTRDEQIRKALIELGWTPPPGKLDTANRWQPINADTPRDGRRILLANDLWDAPSTGCWDGTQWIIQPNVSPFKYQPTHWQELPLFDIKTNPI